MNGERVERVVLENYQRAARSENASELTQQPPLSLRLDVMEHTRGESHVKRPRIEWDGCSVKCPEISLAWKSGTTDLKTLLRNVETCQGRIGKMVAEVGHGTADARTKIQDAASAATARSEGARCIEHLVFRKIFRGFA